MRSAAGVVLPVIVPRAIVLWGLIHLVLAAVPLAGGHSFGSMPPQAIGVVILACVLGLIDIRMRGERVLWANLGVTPLAICVIYAATTIPAEIVLAFVAG